MSNPNVNKHNNTAPHYCKNTYLIEKVQRWFTRIIPALRHLSSGRLKTRERKTRHGQSVSVENTRLEKAAPYDRVGNRETGKCGRHQCARCGKRGTEFHGTSKIQEQA